MVGLPGDAPPAEDGTQGLVAEADTKCMDVTPAPPAAATSVPPTTGPTPVITIDVLMSALKENRDFIIKSVNANMNALSHRIDTNVSSIIANSAAIATHDTRLENQRADIDSLEERVKAIEKGKIAPPIRAHTRAVLSQDYILARRSIRLWPVVGVDEEELWEGVGEFIHKVLMVDTKEIGQDDIESIRWSSDLAPPGVEDRREVVVTFFDKWKRDTVVANSSNLSGRINPAGRPTAAMRALGLRFPRNWRTPSGCCQDLEPDYGLGMEWEPNGTLNLTTSLDHCLPTSNSREMKAGRESPLIWPGKISRPRSRRRINSRRNAWLLNSSPVQGSVSNARPPQL